MILVHRTRGDMSFVTFCTKSAKNTICETFAQNSWRYESCDNFAHTVVISRKTVKSARNTICDTCAQNSRRYEFCDFFAHTVVISGKTVKSAKNFDL